MNRNPFQPAGDVRPAEDPDAVYINAELRAGDTASKRGLEHYHKAGLRLLEKKKKLGHGAWLPWVKAHVQCTDRRARHYMQLAKLEVTSDLEDQWRVISGNVDEDDESDEDNSSEQQHLWEAPDAAGQTDDPATPPELSAQHGSVQGVHRGLDHAGGGQAPDQGGGRGGAGVDPGADPVVPRSGDESPGRDRLGRTIPLATVEPRRTPYFTIDAWAALSKAEQKRIIREASGDAKFNSQDKPKNVETEWDSDRAAEGAPQIEWALWSWNPVTGCRHDCPYCYARDIANRFYEQKFEPAFLPSRLKAPQNTPFPEAKAAEWMGHKNVFVCSMADLFGRWVPAEWVEAVLAEVRAAPQWNFLFLTKFPIRMAEFDFPENVWLGTTVDCQARVANAEKAFRKIKAGVKWLSCEPLIEPLKFRDLGAFQWVVIGGSSRSTQTPEWHPPRAWVNDLEAAARAAGCKVYEKTNLLARVREYPGLDAAEPTEAPEPLRYLPTDGR